MARPKVLVVDSTTAVRTALEKLIQESGGEYRGASDTDGALRILGSGPVQAAFVDTALRPEPLERLMGALGKGREPVVTVGLGMELGAPGSRRFLEAGMFDLAPKPLDPGRIAQVVARALKQARITESCRRLRDGVRGRSGYQQLVGRSSFMENLRGTLERVAPGDGSVLFSGPVGSGRELAARYLHSLSDRRDGPFRLLDCSAFPQEGIGPELFGEDGRQGLLDAAARGTVLLEEVGRIPMEVQIRLAGVMAEGSLGCRLLASTSSELQASVRDGVFHEPFLARLSRSSVVLEPLVRRLEDLPLLASYFLDTICRINNLPPINLSSAALEVLGRHHWPGNIRELRNSMEQAAILASGTVQPEDLPARIREQAAAGKPELEVATLAPFRAAKRKVVDSFEARYLNELLLRKRGNVTAAAEQAGMLRSALQRLLRKHGIRSSEFRKSRGSARSLAAGKKLSAD